MCIHVHGYIYIYIYMICSFFVDPISYIYEYIFRFIYQSLIYIQKKSEFQFYTTNFISNVCLFFFNFSVMIYMCIYAYMIIIRMASTTFHLCSYEYIYIYIHIILNPLFFIMFEYLYHLQVLSTPPPPLPPNVVFPLNPPIC